MANPSTTARVIDRIDNIGNEAVVASTTALTGLWITSIAATARPEVPQARRLR